MTATRIIIRYTMMLFSKKMGPRIGIFESSGIAIGLRTPELFNSSLFSCRKRDEM